MPSGGYRPGAGRPPGSPNKSTTEHAKCISELARAYTKEALETLIDVARNGKSDAARVAAANALLDRGFGKPKPIELAETDTAETPILRVVEYEDT